MTTEEKLKVCLSESLTALKMIATADPDVNHLGLRLLAASGLHVADVIWKEDRQPSGEEVAVWAKALITKIAEASKKAIADAEAAAKAARQLEQMPVSSELPT